MGVLLIEHVTAVTVSVKNKITLSLGVAVGSSIVRIRHSLPFCYQYLLMRPFRQQIALFVIPYVYV